MTVSERVQLLADPHGKKVGVLFAAPLFRTASDDSSAAYQKFMGYLMTVVPLPNMIDSAISLLKYEGANILLHDLSAPSDDSLLYTRSTRLKNVPEEEILADYRRGTHVSESTILDVGGRKWQITVLPARGFFAASFQQETGLILFFGLGLTILLATHMYRRAKEGDRVSEEVEMRTRELSLSKKQTEMILSSTNEGIIGLDEAGDVSFATPGAAGLLEHSRFEMKGMNHYDLFYGGQKGGNIYAQGSHPVTRAVASREVVTVSDDFFRKKSGAPLEVEYTVSPIVEEDQVTGSVVVFRDIAERRRMEKELEKMARYDQLTGLANRTLLLEIEKVAMARASRLNKKIALIYIDLDDFKPINDMLGHEAGDASLKSFANLIRSAVRDYDTPARIGGDEFVILLDNLSEKDEALIIVKRILDQLEKPIHIAGQKFSLRASIGVAFYPDDSMDVDTLLNCADRAMYRAKKNKEHSYVVYEPSCEIKS